MAIWWQWPWRLGRCERAILLVLFLALVSAGTIYEEVHVLNLQADTAMFFIFIDGTRTPGLPITRVNAAINEASWTWSAQSIDQICRTDLAAAL
jgi:hypothetical protein